MSHESLPCKTIQVTQDLSVSFVGPELTVGPLPCLFYFALSAKDSLTLAPFNQPVAYLSHFPLRVFSLTLPGHGGTTPPNEALLHWAQEIAQGNDIITPFIDQVCLAVEKLTQEGLLLPEKMAVAGLSRGGFMAVHAAARIEAFKTILGFAPLTKISRSKDFVSVKNHPLVQALDLDHLVEKISDRTFRFYIGNRDKRVGTERCFNFAQALTESAFHKKIRSPQVELIITPAIGYQGHGTPQESFHAGAQWILSQLGVVDEPV
jgi:esterase FrsA